ncbi:Protein YigP (COG3165) clustered with ubiquinone biosynthetic genes [hydrothermal vent metagenome]|uniref:Protein YigP (COG3165) clustered with ubiquinone biosynthetic genes n=1 Tax=hydrothermal vent metagenome TaxID=652676 RepID=A0A1W1DAU2_9ZZZZ
MQHFALEQALNYLIQTGEIDLKPLDNKTIRFSLQDLPLDVNFVCTNDRIFVISDTNRNSDVDISLGASVFFALFKGEDLSDLLRQDKIVIHGDVKTAQLLVDLLQTVDIDLEEVLSQYTGDIVAHKAGKIAKNFKKIAQKSSNPLDAIKDGLSALLITPTVSKLYKKDRH